MKRHYDDGTEPTILPHVRCCNGPCNQGRKPCPAPDACELQEPQDKQLVLVAVVVVVATLVILLAAIFA